MASEQRQAVIGMDLGGTKLAAAVFAVSDGGLELISALDNLHYKECFERAAKDGELTPEGKSKLIEEAMLDAIARLKKAAGGDEVTAAGIATAGFIEDGYVVEAWNIGMRHYPLRDRIRVSSGLNTFLYKDSWAPVYSVSPVEPCIIFSIGTGFGGVACGADHRVSVRSYSARKKLKWIPCLYMSDDPAYACSFSDDECARIIGRALKAHSSALPEGHKPVEALAVELAAKTREFAKDTGKLSPSRMELFFARALAPRAAARLKADEIFADAPCAAIYPLKLYSWIYGETPSPAEFDKMAAGGDGRALMCFRAQAGFIGKVLALMQAELSENGFSPAERVCGTGSGFNTVNEGFLGGIILESAKVEGNAIGAGFPGVDKIEFVTYDGGGTTLACHGAAAGAARGFVQA